MNNFDALISISENNENSKLYEFLATNYDISNLANKIAAEKSASINILSLKKRSVNCNTASA